MSDRRTLEVTLRITVEPISDRDAEQAYQAMDWDDPGDETMTSADFQDIDSIEADRLARIVGGFFDGGYDHREMFAGTDTYARLTAAQVVSAAWMPDAPITDKAA